MKKRSKNTVRLGIKIILMSAKWEIASGTNKHITRSSVALIFSTSFCASLVTSTSIALPFLSCPKNLSALTSHLPNWNLDSACPSSVTCCVSGHSFGLSTSTVTSRTNLTSWSSSASCSSSFFARNATLGRIHRRCLRLLDLLESGRCPCPNPDLSERMGH